MFAGLRMRGPEKFGIVRLDNMQEHMSSRSRPHEEDYRVHIRGEMTWIVQWRSRRVRRERDLETGLRMRLPRRFSGGHLSDGATRVWWIIHECRPFSNTSEFEVIFVNGLPSPGRGLLDEWQEMVAREFRAYIAAQHEWPRRRIPREHSPLFRSVPYYISAVSVYSV